MTANGEVQTREEATVYVKELDLFVTVMLLEETPAVLSLGKLCEDHVYTYHRTSGQKPHSSEMARELIDCNNQTMPFVVPGLSTSSSASSTPASSTLSSQDTVFDVNRYTENPAIERSGITSEELRGNPLHRPTENQKHLKNEGGAEVQSDISHELLDWLQKFREHFGRSKQSFGATGKPRARKSRHFQVISWIANGVASKSGTGFGQA